jgi:hypothetical protein
VAIAAGAATFSRGPIYPKRILHFPLYMVVQYQPPGDRSLRVRGSETHSITGDKIAPLPADVNKHANRW